jgi:uncharacterized protein with ParB-like and HNH nuclease domain
MVTLKDIIESSSIIHSIPKSIHCNKGIVLDYRLCQTLETEENRKKYDQFYDFDVYLPKYDINLQRPYVWEYYQQKEFIMSILLEKPLESVIVVQHNCDRLREETINYVIDGKQRLITIQKFLHNEFPINIKGENVYWKDFDEEMRMFFRSRVNGITATVYYSYDDCPVTDDMKIILFNYYNFAGTPQTEEHKNKLQSLLNNNN